MSLAFQNGQAAASVERPIDASNPYRKPSKAYFDFVRGYQTAPVYGVKPIARTRREEACSICAEDAARILKCPVEWGLPARAVAWFHDANGRLYALCAEWDVAPVNATRRIELTLRSDGLRRTNITWLDHDENGPQA